MYLYIICVAAGLAVSSLAVLKNMHMFQLNSYAPMTHFRWLRKNFIKQWPQALILILTVLSGIIDSDILHIILIASLLILLLFNKPIKNAKKPLVYTSRVKRMLATVLILYALSIFFSFVFDLKYIIVGSLYVLTPVMPVIANSINFPIELSVRRWYINDAKKILKSCSNLIIIGITGSYGKTSVKYYLNTLLKAKYNVLMTPESFNTPMGITKTIRESLKPTHEIFICEMGAKYKKEIKELCDIVRPQHGIITSIGPQHLETFKSIETIIKTKFELADAVKNKGMLFLNGDNEIIMNNLHDQEYQTYGLNQTNQYYAYDVSTTQKGTTFSVICKDNKLENLNTQLIGYHNVLNLVGAIALSLFLDVQHEDIARQLKKLTSPPHRLQLLKNDGTIIIDDAYNSNPSGCKAALDTLGLFDGYKILITPGMVELGAQQDNLNYAFGEQAAAVCDYVILIGEKQTKPIYNGLINANFDKSNILIANQIKDGINQAYAIKTEKQKILLLENDLPDNY